MIIELKKLLKKCQRRIAGGSIGDPGALEQDDKGKALDGTPLDRLTAGTTEDGSLQHPRWDLFFSILLDPQAKPGLDCTPTSVGGSKTQDVTERPWADVEEVACRFSGNAAIQSLKAQLDNVPEIRQQRVDSLRQALAEGRYPMHPYQIAEAMLADGGLNRE